MIRKTITAFVPALIAACATPQPECSEAVRVADLPPVLDEASGIAFSRVHDGVLWAHNDSEGVPALYALDQRARLLAEIAMPAAGTQFDWEDIAAGPCPQGSCLYIGDIGDNRHERDDRAVLRMPEPALSPAAPQTIERFPYALPDGPEDAEALFVTRDTAVYIITKGRRSAPTLYRYPSPLRADERVTLQRVQELGTGIAQLPDMVTGADASGDLLAVRTYATLRLYRFDGDTLALISATDLTRLAEPQGEGVAIRADGTVLLVTETGPDRIRPFMSRLMCTLP